MADSSGTAAGVLRRLRGIFAAPNYKPPVLPKAAAELLVLSRRQDVRIDEILHLLEQDPLLCSSILRVARSASYSRGNPVASLREAIVRLGLSTISQIFFEVATSVRVFRAPAYDGPMARLRAHSAATAHVAGRLARDLDMASEDAFIAGLLHDVGIAVSLIALAESYPNGKTPSFDDAWPAVQEVHEEAGAFVAQLWDLPEYVVHVAGRHHIGAFDAQQSRIIALNTVAEAVAIEGGMGLLDEALPEHAWALEHLGLKATVPELAKRLQPELARAAA